MRGLIVCAALAALAGVASADDAAAITRVVGAQVKAINDVDGASFAATFADDAFAIQPGGYAITPTAIGKAMACSWSNPEGSYRVKLVKAVAGHQRDVGWATVDLSITQHVMDSSPSTYPLRFTELFTRDGTAWKAHAYYVSLPEKDDPDPWGDEREVAEIAQDAPPGAPIKDAPMSGWLATTGDLAGHLHAGDDVIVLGSAAGERGEGARGAKLLGTWKTLAFTPAWTRAGGDGRTWAWLAARVSRKAKGKGRTVDEPYWALILALRDARDWEIVSVHYGQTRPTPDELPGCMQ